MNIFTPSSHTSALALLSSLTSPLQPSSQPPDLPSALDLSDKLKSRSIPAPLISTALLKSVESPNPHEVRLSCWLLDVLLKNAGKDFFRQVSTEQWSRTLERALLDGGRNPHVRQSLLEVIQVFALLSPPSPAAPIRNLYSELKYRRTVFPPLPPLNMAVAADTAQPPEWTNADICRKCRAAFGILNRRHHCRACGNAFCGSCAAEECELPDLGLEGKQRVCSTCATLRSSRGRRGNVDVEAQGGYDDYGFPTEHFVRVPDSAAASGRRKRVTFNPTEGRRTLSEGQTGLEELEAEDEQMRWAIQESLKTNPSQPPPVRRQAAESESTLPPPPTPPLSNSQQMSRPVAEPRKKYVPVALPSLPAVQHPQHDQRQQPSSIPQPQQHQGAPQFQNPNDELQRMSHMTHAISGVMRDLDEAVARYAALQQRQIQQQTARPDSASSQIPNHQQQIPYSTNINHGNQSFDHSARSNPSQSQVQQHYPQTYHNLQSQPQPLTSGPHEFKPRNQQDTAYPSQRSQTITPDQYNQPNLGHVADSLSHPFSTGVAAAATQIHEPQLNLPNFPTAPSTAPVAWPSVPSSVPSQHISQKEEEQPLIEL